MTRQADRTILDDVVKLVASHGTEAMSAAFATLLEIGMKLEREQVLEAGLWERTGERRGYANGYKPKSLKTRVGEITVQVPSAPAASAELALEVPTGMALEGEVPRAITLDEHGRATVPIRIAATSEGARRLEVRVRAAGQSDQAFASYFLPEARLARAEDNEFCRELHVVDIVGTQESVAGLAFGIDG